MTSVSVSRNHWYSNSGWMSGTENNLMYNDHGPGLNLPAEYTSASGSSDLDEDIDIKEEVMSQHASEGTETASGSHTSSNLSDVTDIESTMDLYLAVETGVASDIQERDKILESLAQYKRSVAETEHKLAMFRMKEVTTIRRLHGILENLAQKRQLQADLNVERLRHFFKESRRCGCDVDARSMLSDIVAALSRPTEPIL